VAWSYSVSLLNDVERMLKALKDNSLDRKDDEQTDHIHRALHSIQTRAASLGWKDLETEVHALKAMLKLEGKGPGDWSAPIQRLEQIRQFRIQTIPEVERVAAKFAENVEFTELERRILNESRRLNEFFYRLICKFAPSKRQPHSRALLLTHKLEAVATLVKTEPSVSNPDEDFTWTSFWLTSDIPKSELLESLNIDQAEIAELIHLDYQEGLDQKEDMAWDIDHSTKEESSLVIERSRYAEAMRIADELAWRVENHLGTTEAALASQLQRTLEFMAYQPLEPLLIALKGAVERLMEKKGVKARFEWSVSSVGIDGVTLESLGEILKQLIQNSIVHGIESPDERLNAGKNELGLITLHQEMSVKSCKFVFHDDGRGIDEEMIVEEAKRQGIISKSKTPSLLSILCHPWFSTTTDPESGASVGLDMIRRLVSSEFDSELELVNNPGKGLTVKWSMPERCLQRPFLVFESGGRKWAILTNSVKTCRLMNPSLVDDTKQRYKIGEKSIPMIGPLGPCPPGTVAKYCLEIDHRGRQVALLVDNLLNEEPWGPDDLVAADPAGPWCRALKDSKDGIPILSSALVYAAE